MLTRLLHVNVRYVGHFLFLALIMGTCIMYTCVMAVSLIINSILESAGYIQVSTQLSLRSQGQAGAIYWPEDAYHASPEIPALRPNSTNGFLSGQPDKLLFRPYLHEVDLRIIVITYNRSSSLHKCLHSLNQANYFNDRVSLHVWVDRDPLYNSIDRFVHEVAKDFQFIHGHYTIHLQDRHVGIQGQWTNTWRPHPDTKEIAVIIEDDLTVSPHFWKWLKPASQAYRGRSDISGVGLAGPGIAHKDGTRLTIPSNETVYLYRVICTWGFAPNPSSWRAFQDWFYRVEGNSSFLPLVPGILPTQWFLGELVAGRERGLWEMWHIYYTHNTRPPQFTALANTRGEGSFVINRHEIGVHDDGRSIITDYLCDKWLEHYDRMPKYPNKYDYDGSIIDAPHL